MYNYLQSCYFIVREETSSCIFSILFCCRTNFQVNTTSGRKVHFVNWFIHGKMESLKVLVFYANIIIQILYSLDCNMANWVTPSEHGDFSSLPGLLLGTVLLRANLSKVSSMVMCMICLTHLLLRHLCTVCTENNKQHHYCFTAFGYCAHVISSCSLYGHYPNQFIKFTELTKHKSYLRYLTIRWAKILIICCYLLT